MSGFVLIINQDGAPVPADLLRRMADHLGFRGPDAQEMRINGNVGMGHALLRTAFESEFERQPFSLDGQVWIAADARVDGRAELIRRLAIKDHDLKNAPDCELILHAYNAWGEDCVDHLIGDFAFAVWDERKRNLFCARDHLGVKPFYYAQSGGRLIISNTLDCVRLHPAVSDELNEQAIGDFLLVGSNEEPDTTFFAEIKRLPAAHTLTWSRGDLKVRRYWSLPIEEEIRYRRESDYVDHFVELLEAAVEDRLRTDRVGVFMSGGMDSTTVAGAAHKLLSKSAAPFDMRAFTIVYDRLIPDDERYYSGLVAEKLDIPIDYLVADDYRLYERWGQPEFKRPEPFHAPLAAVSVDRHKQAAAHSRVALTGEGGDAILRPSVSHLLTHFKKLRIGRLLMEIGLHLWTHRRLPRVGLRTRLRHMSKGKLWFMPYPEWLNPDFETRLNLSERWTQLNINPALAHPFRPEAYQILTDPCWTALFESYDPGTMRLPIEIRHPLLDLRLVVYSLRIPSLPWCVDKRLVRVSTRDILPEQVRNRQKTPVARSPVASSLRSHKIQLPDRSSLSPELGEYIDAARWLKAGDATFSQIPGPNDTIKLWSQMRPLTLDHWLKSSRISETFHTRLSTST